jgi:APA family basic amino acid/polyamine antiporter
MIGTGIFTSLGFQVMALHSGMSLLSLWLLGGISSLIGALAYAELATTLPRSGGEYNFLSVIYHPSLGFLAGWISFIVGFAAPTAAASIALGAYLKSALALPAMLYGIRIEKYIAVCVLLLITLLHSTSKKTGAHFQSLFTSLKILILLLLIILGLSTGVNQQLDFSFNRQALKEIISPAFAVSFFFVSFSYSGWNSAAYIAGEIRNPGKNIPLSLVTGTLIVTSLYVLITYCFLRIIPVSEMSGKIEIGYLFGNQVFSTNAAKIMGFIFSLLLLSTVSALTLTGPRVTQVMGEDYKAINWFRKLSAREIPVRAILVQSALACIYILTSTFEQVITYIGFTLNLFTLLAVAGLFILRKKYRDAAPAYRMKLFPVLPVIFVLINVWILVYGLIYKPFESFAGILTAATGLIFYYAFRNPSDRSIR